jgi:selenide,water dikinase
VTVPQSGVRLTELSHGAGCGCKLPADALSRLLGGLERPEHPDLLVGLETSDDAGVFRLREDLALVQTVDFFTPIVDDPYTFGWIAATNALSDVYAMGGEPITALNLMAVSLDRLGDDVVREILRGGLEAITEAGAVLLGGHSIDDPEPKYGLAVTGTVDPRELLTNATGQPGDVLVLTKPIGVGVIVTAAKRGRAAPDLLQAAVSLMSTSNREAGRAAKRARAHAATDVTGFGLLGHLHELARASGLAAELEASAVPVLSGALELIEDDELVCGGSARNRSGAESYASFDASVPEGRRRILADAVTSGGLLVSLPRERAVGIPGSTVGRLVGGVPGDIRVHP